MRQSRNISSSGSTFSDSSRLTGSTGQYIEDGTTVSGIATTAGSELENASLPSANLVAPIFENEAAIKAKLQALIGEIDAQLNALPESQSQRAQSLGEIKEAYQKVLKIFDGELATNSAILGLSQRQATIINQYVADAGLSNTQISASPEASSGAYMQEGLLLTGVGAGVNGISTATRAGQYIWSTALTLWSADNLRATVTGAPPVLNQLTNDYKLNLGLGLALIPTSPAPSFPRSLSSFPIVPEEQQLSTFFHGTSAYVANEMVENQGINIQRLTFNSLTSFSRQAYT